MVGWIALAVLGVAAAGLALRRRYLVVNVRGESMAPTLRDGDRILVRRVPGGRVRTGQIVVLDGPALRAVSPPLGLLVKRVVAAGGEPVPAFLAERGETGTAGRVPPGKLVVLGDNRAASVDSRAVGFFSTDGVAGVMLRRMRSTRG